VSFRRPALAALTTLGLFAAGGFVACKRTAQPAVARLALIPIESLAPAHSRIADARALNVLLRVQLTGLADVLPLRSSDSSDAARQRASSMIQGYLTEDSSGLILRLHERTPEGKTLRVIESRNTSIAALASDSARQLYAKPRPLPALTNEAVTAFGTGLMLENRAGAVDSLRRAVEMAPAWGEAWFSLCSALVAAGRTAEALPVMRAALAPASPVDAVARAQIRYLAASVSQPADLAEAALVLAKLLPADAEWQARAGSIGMRRRQFADAERWYRAAIKADPNLGALWNELAYAQALGGNLEGALQSLDTYARIEPKSANPLDSRGELLFLHARFREAAEAFEQAHAREPSFIQGHTLRKAAEARLLAGDRPGAQAQMDKLLREIPDESGARELARAQWEYRTGRKAEALKRLGPAAGRDPAARAQLAVWLIVEGKRDEALALARTIPGRFGMLVAFLSQPPASADAWRQRAGAAFAQPQMQALGRLATAYALLLDGHGRDAAGLLKELAAESNPAGSGQLTGMYRQALLRSGQKELAEKEAVGPALPTVGPDAVFDFLAWDAVPGV
jgi:tetratricopeptide (TPR) repeat protein